MLGWLRERRRFRQRISVTASTFLEWFGQGAYWEARRRRIASRGSAPDFRFWTAVMLEIARRTGRPPRLDTATHYLSEGRN